MNEKKQSIMLKSLWQSISLIQKNKLLLVFLLMMQIAFFVVLTIISFSFQSVMFEKQNAINSYVENLNLTDEKIASSISRREGILGEDPLLVDRNFRGLVTDFRMYMISLFIVSTIFTALAWSLTFPIAKGKSWSFSPWAGKFFAILLVVSAYLGALFLIFYALFSVTLISFIFDIGFVLRKLVVFLILASVLGHLMFVSICMILVKGLKNLTMNTIVIGIKKARYLLLTSIINLAAMGAIMYTFIYLASEETEPGFYLSLLLFTLLIFIIAFQRVYKAVLVGNLQSEV